MTDIIQNKPVLYTNPQSRGRIARRMLEELGIEYDAIVLNFGEHKNDEFLKINPMGKFPTLVHNGIVVTEAAAIVTYLADAYFDKGLAPALDDKSRGTYLRWIFYAAGPLEAAIINKALGVQIEDKQKIFVGYGCFDDVIKTIDELLSNNEYVLGDKFSAADVYLGSSIHFGLSFKLLPELPSFIRYSEQIFSRDAIKRSEEIDNTIMASSAKA